MTKYFKSNDNGLFTLTVVAPRRLHADSSRAPGPTSVMQGSVNVHRGALLLVPQLRCISSFVFYIPKYAVFLTLLFYFLQSHRCCNGSNFYIVCSICYLYHFRGNLTENKFMGFCYILDNNECLNSVCQLHAACNNTVGGYDCQCRDGFNDLNGICQGKVNYVPRFAYRDTHS